MADDARTFLISYQTPGGLTVRRIQPRIGAEITGVDLRQPIAPEVARDIRQTLLDHGVIFFRGQPIDYAQHLALARIFGEPMIEGFYPDRPEVMPLISDAASPNPAGGHWHSDGTYLPVAHAVSILRAIKAAPLGGDTLFASATGAYESLPEATKARIATLRARAGLSHILKVKGLDGIDGYGADADRPPDWVEHPVVVVHPETGEPVLYVNEVHTIGIVGLGEAENAELMRELTAPFRRPELQMRWTWSDNAIAVWDNRQVQHFAVRDETGPRHVERIAVAGRPHIALADRR